jgi:hypothetical protein
MIGKRLFRDFKRSFDYYKGWSTKRKIVVIESDDWGSIRMPSVEVQTQLRGFGIDIDKCPYNLYDSIESNSDLENLFNVLVKHTDFKGNPAKITANAILANPDFEAIRKSNFSAYKFEHFQTTLQRYPNRDKVFDLYKKGMDESIFHPQFHGREHLNVNRWMEALQMKSKETHISFENLMFGISTNITLEKRKSYLAAFDLDQLSELTDQKLILIDGLRIFNETFGFKSESFIAPNYYWHSELEETLKLSGVKYIQGGGFQNCPTGSGVKVIKHAFGAKNSIGQIYLRRNCVFEPSIYGGINSIDSLLNDIKLAFFWNKPAIITSHRLNYMGSLNLKNRDENLKQLDQVLNRIINKWPEVEFMSSDQLGREMENTN